jgi:2,4-diaminopentanoate dehydrogenase
LTRNAVPVVVFGLGPIGVRICNRLLSRTADVDVVGAVDSDPTKSGLTLGAIPGMEASSTIVVTSDASAPPAGGGVAIQATSSSLHLAAPQAMHLARLGWNVLSSCEELAFPRGVDPEVADELDAVAQKAGVTVLASGVNPGFMMDTLPLTLTGLCTRVDGISVRRVVDTNWRREQLQRKAGVGMARDEFERLATESRIGHVGLRQSVQLIAARLGWTLTGVDLSLQPVIADAPVSTPLGTVPAGSVIGQHQLAIGHVASHEPIRLELVMAAGYSSIDEVVITGDPTVHQVIEGGLNGDVGTEAVIANLVRPVYAARPGLLTMADLVAIACDVA